MKKILISLTMLFSITSLFSIATVKDFYGKVKVKYDGDSAWSRIELGQDLPPNATISTGFNSQVVLDLGNATLDVLPLTRMTVTDITESQDTIATSLFLQGGKIKADVGHVSGKVNDFKIKSPVATASVRGTSFEFSGNTLKVLRGVVAFGAPKKKSLEGSVQGEDSGNEPEGVAVKAGGKSQMSSIGSKPIKPATMARKAATVSASTKPSVIKNVIRDSVVEIATEATVPSVVAIQKEIKSFVSVSVKIKLED